MEDDVVYEDFNDFMKKVLEVFPEAQVGQDNDGQLVIYTNLTTIPDGLNNKVVKMPDKGDTSWG